MSEWSSKIARVDQPEPGLLSLSIRSEGRNEALLLVTLPGALALGVVDERPRGASASPAVTQLRRHIEGARIESVEMSQRALHLLLTRAGESRALIASPTKPYGAWWLSETEGSLLLRSPGAPAELPSEGEHLQPRSLEELREAGKTAQIAHVRARKTQLQRALLRQVKRLKKKRSAILGDLERVATAEELHEKASLILAHASEIPTTAGHFETMSWEDVPRPVRIELDPRRSPSELAQDLFKKSKRLKRGLDVAPERLGMVEAELETLHRAQADFDDSSAEDLTKKLAALGVSITAPKEEARKRRQAGDRLPYREFSSADGSALLVGRSAADNDQLTLRHARPHDLWLHARGVTGAHVVVRLAKGKSCAPETLVDAASLAAHFSDLRGEAVVDVLYTARRFVHKRKGSAVGSVTLGSEKVIALRVEQARLQRLLGGEKKKS